MGEAQSRRMVSDRGESVCVAKERVRRAPTGQTAGQRGQSGGGGRWWCGSGGRGCDTTTGTDGGAVVVGGGAVAGHKRWVVAERTAPWLGQRAGRQGKERGKGGRERAGEMMVARALMVRVMAGGGGGGDRQWVAWADSKTAAAEKASARVQRESARENVGA
jgi:hypothetical protein